MKILDSLIPTLITSGSESQVYSVRDPKGQSLILKKAKIGGHHNYAFEAFAYQELAGRGAKVPDVIYVDEDNLLLSLIPGEEMDNKKELLANEQLFSDIARTLAICCEITLSGFGAAKEVNGLFTGTSSSWQAFMHSTESLFESTALNEAGLSHATIAHLQQFWQKQVPLLKLEKGALVHGDFAMSAIFVDGKHFTGLIDFGDAFIGDPLMDIAYFRFKEITKSYGFDIYKRLSHHYAAATHLAVDHEFEQKIVLYMIYFGLQRITYCPDVTLRQTFGKKLQKVADICYQNPRLEIT